MAAEAGSKVAVITGASSGIGRAAAQAFARQGWRLVLAARSQAALEIAAQNCSDAGGEALPFACDVTQFDDIRALAEAAKQRYGQLDVWVNDAGMHMPGRFEDLPLEDFRQIVEVNLMGTVHGCRAALAVFRAQGHGVLINIAAMADAMDQPFASAYAASKWAVRGLSEALRMEVQDTPGIHVCTVLPVHSPEELADIIVSMASKPEHEVSMGMSRLTAAAAAAVMVAVPLGIYAWRRMRGQSAYV